jgi:hypothetical protein
VVPVEEEAGRTPKPNWESLRREEAVVAVGFPVIAIMIMKFMWNCKKYARTVVCLASVTELQDAMLPPSLLLSRSQSNCSRTAAAVQVLQENGVLVAGVFDVSVR